jgi:hypothetical protein
MADSAPTSPSAPTVPSRSTETPSDLAQNQAAHAIDPKASHRALQIPEILEHILVHLPFKYLFVHQRVSRTFQTSIAKSPAIWRKMFLTLDKNTPLETWKLRKSDHKRGRGKHRWKFYPGTNDEPGITTPVTLNPMLKVTWRAWPGARSCARRKQSHGAERVQLKDHSYTTDPDSSLIAMYVSDPPCKVLTVSVQFRSLLQGRLGGYYSESVKLQSETGLKLGDVWDGSMGDSGVFRQVGDNEVPQQDQVVALRRILAEMGHPSVAIQSLSPLELMDVVVPTDEEWAVVKQRGARR